MIRDHQQDPIQRKRPEIQRFDVAHHGAIETRLAEEYAAVMSIGKDVFLALVAIANADAKVDKGEVVALMDAAKIAGLGSEEIAVVRAAANAKLTIEKLEVAHLGREDRLFVYAMAYGITRADGEMSESEDALLTALGKRLELSDRSRMDLEALVDEVAAREPGKHLNFEHLRRTMGPRISTF
jgi:uncharacterized membrane protein YebE (DUF533 family)